KWEFPGGKVEVGESEINCLIREIKEELNIIIDPFERCQPHIHDYKSFKIKLIPYLSKYLSGEIKLLEHEEAKWIEIDGLINLDWAPADLPILMDFLNFENGTARSL
ncbi:MAG: (deoxy)nucleoside triphosphate pyrophosphohydrolase, partial [Bacteroidales bacterium]|nr:(deoxy)nucleoside triphosphate pyrophosphohydrolase [Bacteroidales bacterium]